MDFLTSLTRKQKKIYSSQVKTGLILFLTVIHSAPVYAHHLQQDFDSFPITFPTPITYVAPSNRVVNYTVFGPQNGWPVLLLNGNPSNYTSIDLLSPYRSFIEKLNLRFINPERIGYGITPFNCRPPYTDCITPEQYADDWASLMKSLGYKTYSIFAASQGGQYADFFVKKYGNRVRSLHLSSAIDTSGSRDFCPLATDPLFFKSNIEAIYQDPSLLWVSFPTRDFETVSSLPGGIDWFSRTTAANTDGSGSSYDLWLECRAPVGDLSKVKTPVFIYHGLLDQTVPISIAENHAQAYKNVVRFRTYPNDAHLASIRYLGQTFLDIRNPEYPLRLICLQWNNGSKLSINETLIVPERLADDLISKGYATEDICAWVGTPGQ